jgi:hypothetical protein
MAQEDSNLGAETAILLTGDIPIILTDQDNILELQFQDRMGVNWTNLQQYTILPTLHGILELFGNEIEPTELAKMRAFFITRFLWPVILHREWAPFLGYSKIIFDAEIVGNHSGWSASVSPRTIGQSTNGTKALLSLNVQVTDLASENTAIVRISATRYNKDNSLYGTSYYEIPVRSDRLDYIDIKPLDPVKEVPPDSFVYYQIEITNKGYFTDTFLITTQSDSSIKAQFNEQSLVLNPGETRIITLQVMTDDIFFDPGTTRTINITSQSLKFPEKTFYAQVQVITKGFYLSPLLIFYIVLILIILILIYFIFFYRKQKKDRELFGKPQKPWNIPIEKRHLEELKQKDKEAYDKERLMMEDEYKSAMLWYDSYQQSIKQEKQIGKSKQLNLKVNEFFKKPENKKVKPEKKKEEKQPKDKKKPAIKQKDNNENVIKKFFSKSEKKEKQPKDEKKPVNKVEEKKEEPKETPEIIKDQYKAIQKRSAESERRKQIALEKIKRAQEKQKGKIKK